MTAALSQLSMTSVKSRGALDVGTLPVTVASVFLEKTPFFGRFNSCWARYFTTPVLAARQVKPASSKKMTAKTYH